jgi:hypothetical protein
MASSLLRTTTVHVVVDIHVVVHVSVDVHVLS